MIRFLRYALEHDRRIRAVFLRDGKMMQKTVSVLAYDGDTAGFACFPGARLYGWRLVCTTGAVLLRGAPMLSSCELV